MSNPYSRRDFMQTLTFTVLSAGLAGCGSSGGTDLASTGPTGFTSSSGLAAFPDVPVLSPSSRVEAQIEPGVDAGTLYTVQVVASLGGQFTLPDGTRLVIPPGALPQDTEISVLVPSTQAAGGSLFRYVISPSGLVLNKPAFLSIPLVPTNIADLILCFTSSPATPLEDVGSEQTNWKVAVPASGQGGQALVISLPHFTFIFGLRARDLGQYLVTDIPPENLQIGDLLFFLTFSGESVKWRPGHVAMLVRNGNDQHQFANRVDRLIEAGGSEGSSPGNTSEGTLASVRNSDGHIYLGPRRHPGDLDPTQQVAVKNGSNPVFVQNFHQVGILC